MKKKILSFMLIAFLLIPFMFVSTACDKEEDNKNVATVFCLLEPGQTLNIGTNVKLKNSKEIKIEKYYIELPVSATINLRRTSYDNGLNCVQYGSNYYYWDIDAIYDSFLAGNKIVATTKTYSYLTYGYESNNIVVKATTEIETNYDYPAKMFEKPCEITYNLNSYFSSIASLKETVPELYNNITISENNKYYIKNAKTVYAYSENAYEDTYYYFS